MEISYQKSSYEFSTQLSKDPKFTHRRFSESISFSVTSRYHRATKLDTLRVQGCFEMYV